MLVLEEGTRSDIQLGTSLTEAARSLDAAPNGADRLYVAGGYKDVAPTELARLFRRQL